VEAFSAVSDAVQLVAGRSIVQSGVDPVATLIVPVGVPFVAGVTAAVNVTVDSLP